MSHATYIQYRKHIQFGSQSNSKTRCSTIQCNTTVKCYVSVAIQTCENKCVEKGVQFNESHYQCKTTGTTADIQIDASTLVQYTADIQIDASTSSMSVDVTDLVVDWIKLLYYRKNESISMGAKLLPVTTFQ